MEFEPYKMDSFKELMNRAYNLGWYSGRKTLVTLKMDGEFEGFSGRASESWEQRFFVETEEVKGDGDKLVWPHIKVSGATVEEACKAALDRLDGRLADEDIPY